MRRKTTAGLTGVMVPIFVADTSSTTGGGLSGLVFNSAGLVAEYRRRGASSWTAITLAAGTLGTWSSGGFVADGALAGAYELGLPDAAVAAGAQWVAVRLRGATNMLAVLIEIELDAVNYQDATRFGLTALPNFAAGSASGLPTLDASLRVNTDVRAFGGNAGTFSAGLPTVELNMMQTVSGVVSSTVGWFFTQTKVSADAASGNSTTLINRLGAFTGSGVNTVLGFLRSLARKDLTAPSDVGGTFDPTNDSAEALRDRGDAAWITATGFAVPGSAMALTPGERSTLVAAIEAEIADDATGAAVKQAIVNKLLENLPDLDDLTLAAIEAAAEAGSGTALAAMFDAIRLAKIDGAMQGASYTAPDNVSTAAAKTAAEAAKAVTDKLDTMIEPDGPVHRLTANSLELAPAGGGGGGGGLSPEQDALLTAIHGVTQQIGAGDLDVVNNSGVSATGEIEIHRGDTIDFTLTAAEAIDDAESLWLTWKRRDDQDDAEAVLQLTLDGLSVLNGGSPSAGQTGSLAIEDAVARTIRVQLSETAAAALAPHCGVYDVQKRTAAGSTRTVGRGTGTVTADVTRTTGAAA